MKKIAFLDSGIGGLNVLNTALKILPYEHYIYYADSDHVPYGNKPAAEIKQYILSAAEFLANLDIKALVIACNTATSIAVDDLRKLYKFPVIGMEPAIKPALQKCKNANDKVLLLATPLTLREAKLAKLIASMSATDKIDMLALPELVVFAEQLYSNLSSRGVHISSSRGLTAGSRFPACAGNDSEQLISYLKEKLVPYNLENYKAVVFGCTHFLFFKELFADLLPKHISIIDGAMGTILRLKDLLIKNNLLNIDTSPATVEFYRSGRRVTSLL